MIDFSIIIPVYNAEKYIATAIESVLKQSYSKYEIIVINDGSTDNSGEILKSYCGRNNIQIITTENRGVSSARNTALKAAKGRWLFCMDADDSIENGFFEQLVDICEKGYEMVVFGATFHYVQLNSIVQRHAIEADLHCRSEIKTFLSSMDLETKDVFLNYLWTRVFDLRIIQTNNLLFDETVSLGEDFKFITNYISLCSKVFVTKLPLYNYMIRGNNSLATRFYGNEYQRRIIMRDSFKHLLNSFDIDEGDCSIFKENEGLNCIISISKVLSSNCSLKKRTEKINYINQFLTYTDKAFMYDYLKKNPSIRNKLFRLFLMIDSPNLLYLFLRFVNRIQHKG